MVLAMRLLRKVGKFVPDKPRTPFPKFSRLSGHIETAGDYNDMDLNKAVKKAQGRHNALSIATP